MLRRLEILSRKPVVTVKHDEHIDENNQRRDQYGKALRKDYHMKLYKNPYEILVAIQDAGVKKSNVLWFRILLLSIWAGVYIGFGGIFAATAAGGINAATAAAHPSLRRIIFAIFFPSALALIVLVGGELFTGNMMYMLVSIMSRKISFVDLLKSWFISFFGNYIGAVAIAALAYGGHLYDAEPYLTYIHSLAVGKVTVGWVTVLIRAIPCNILVCSSIYIAISAEDVISKMAGAWFSITAFATSGFEHCIANIFLIHLGMFYGAGVGYGEYLTHNLLPAILGNLIGGGLFALLYWYLYIAEEKHKQPAVPAPGDIELEVHDKAEKPKDV